MVCALALVDNTVKGAAAVECARSSLVPNSQANTVRICDRGSLWACVGVLGWAGCPSWLVSAVLSILRRVRVGYVVICRSEDAFCCDVLPWTSCCSCSPAAGTPLPICSCCQSCV